VILEGDVILEKKDDNAASFGDDGDGL